MYAYTDLQVGAVSIAGRAVEVVVLLNQLLQLGREKKPFAMYMYCTWFLAGIV